MTQSIRQLLRHQPLLQAAPQVWNQIAKDAGSEAEALAQFEEALDRWARKRPPFRPFMEHIAPSVRGEPLIAFLGAWTMGRWYASTKEGLGGLMVLSQAVIAGVSDAAGKVTPTQMRTLEIALPLLEGAPKPLRIPAMLLMLREGYGMALAQDDDPVIKRRGLRLLEQVVAEAEAEFEAPSDPTLKTVVEHMLAKSQANVAETIRQLVEAGQEVRPVPALRRAIQFLDRAVASRAQDPDNPVNFVNALRIRGSTHRSLSMHVEDERERRNHLEESVQDAQAATRIIRMHPGEQFLHPDDLRVNEINARCDLAEDRVSTGDWSGEEAVAEFKALERIAGTLGRAPDLRGRTHQDTALSSIRHARGRIEGTGAAPTYAAALKTARALVDGQRREPRAKGIASMDALNLFRTMRHLIAGTPDDPDPIEPDDWSIWRSFYGSMRVEVSGASQAMMAMLFEAELLGREARRDAGAWDWLSYLEARLNDLETSMCDPTATAHERQVYAAWIKRLVSSALHIDNAHGILRPEQRLWLLDLGGSSAWRSDLAFFGGGPCVEMSKLFEAGWRMDLYRARWERDTSAQVLAHKAAGELLVSKTGAPREMLDMIDRYANRLRFEVFPEDTATDLIEARTGVPREQWQSGPDGIYVPRIMSDEKCRQELNDLADDIRENIEYGAARGWIGTEFGRSPRVDPRLLREWLLSGQDLLLLTASTDGLALFTSADGNVLEQIVPLNSSGGDAFAELELARQEYAYGPENQAAGFDWAGVDPIEMTRPGWRPDGVDLKGPTAEGAKRLLSAVEQLLDDLADQVAPALQAALDGGIQRIAILPRGWMRQVPWGALPIARGLLQDQVELAWFESLAELPASPPRKKTRSVLYVGQADREDAELGIGRAALGPVSDEASGPLPRDDFERLVSEARVLRLYAHGETILASSDASGFVLDADLDWGGARYSNSETRLLDLQGARRVELWACESGVDSWMFRFSAEHDEPGGTDAAVLLAGAECAVSSMWIQDALGTAMLAEAFSLYLRTDPSLTESAALGKAIHRYRAAVDASGVFTKAVEAASQRSGAQQTHEDLRLHGWNAWRVELWSDLSQCPPPPATPRGRLEPAPLGPAASRRARAASGDAHALRTAVEEVMTPLRSKLVWTGWKVTYRSRGAYRPAGG